MQLYRCVNHTIHTQVDGDETAMDVDGSTYRNDGRGAVLLYQFSLFYIFFSFVRSVVVILFFNRKFLRYRRESTLMGSVFQESRHNCCSFFRGCCRFN